MIRIENATIKDISIIQDIAYKTWPITFAEILSETQIKYMLNWMYSTESLQNQMENNNHFILAKDDNEYLGFAAFEHHYKNTNSTRLHKIYLLPSSQGKGIGKKLISEVENRTKWVNDITLELNVNRFNQAIDFYKWIGFEIIKQEDIAIGEGFLMEDYVMMKLL